VKKSAITIIVGGVIGLIVILMVVPDFTVNNTGYFRDFRCSGSAQCIRGQVDRVIDGDTLEVNGIRIRLALTSTPEISEEYGLDAKYFTSEFCPVGTEAVVDEDDMQTGGSYGRTIGKVFCENGLLNSALLENDLAYIDERFCTNSEFAAEDWAQKYGCATKTESKQQIPKESQTPTLPSGGTPSPIKEKQCDSSYPDVCIPPYPPDLDCGDIPYKNFRVLPPDPHRFDGDKDGIGCEK
jgi:micrococcal nuclease